LTTTLLHAISVCDETGNPPMKIKEVFERREICLSFEVFPPKREGNFDELFPVIEELGEFDPDFISVTYGAGGSTRDLSIEIASRVKNECKREVLAHLTCVNATQDDIASTLDAFHHENIENILALRGDPPTGEAKFVPTAGGFRFANDLVSFIRHRDSFSIGVAGYPEGHPEAPDRITDLKNLKRKVDAGADFIVTQLFFRNEDFFRFRERALSLGIIVPIVPGIWPILNYQQIRRIVSLCGATIPSRLGDKMEKLKDKAEEIEKYGIEYAIVQADELLHNEVAGLHIYSMNRSQPALQILRELSFPAKRRKAQA
jgi:methylenetetrahydrofolate reductase (NADPH)